MGQLPFVSCLCPTYLRPRLLENAIACFLAQDYPVERRELIILDDAGQHTPQHGPGWKVVSINRRFRSLPEKFNAIAGIAKGEILCVWEDDDVYLPWHISAHVAALRHGGYGGFSKPSRVLSTYTGKLAEENATGRFHASIAFSREWFDRIGGWPVTQRGDFDQQFISRLGEFGIQDTCKFAKPSYVFRWGSTGAYHGQSFMRSPDDEGWYQRVEFAPPEPVGELHPHFDDETLAIMETFRPAQ